MTGPMIAIALKSLIVAAGVLLILRLAHRRSAADRSLIAHLGLAAVLLLPLGGLLLPSLAVSGPDFLAADAAPPVEANVPGPMVTPADLPAGAAVTEVEAPSFLVGLDVPLLLWALPALILAGLTLVALLRLVLLKSRANVLVEPQWTSALAHAQRRMGFKHGTALLTSDELPSPISWGVVRPVILLNSEAAEAHQQAEAVIAHELAHVAHLDWAKLLLSRIVVALFWFNPLVWLLAREAHQLREEAADDAVLAAQIDDTEYAQLLVGVARHECRGLLLGAHGVAPARNSLARRVRRVLDTALERAPGGWQWTSAAAFFAAGMAVPLAALTFVPPGSELEAASTSRMAATNMDAPFTIVPPTTPVLSTTPQLPSAADPGVAKPAPLPAPVSAPSPLLEGRPMMIANRDGTAILRGANGATMVARPDGTASVYANGRAIAVASADGTSFAMTDRRDRRSDAVNRAVSMKAVGASPEYARSLAAAGYGNLSADDLIKVRALGIDANYIRSIAAAGYRRLTVERLVELKALGVTAAEIDRYRRAKGSQPDIQEIIEFKALGIPPHESYPDADDHDPGG